MEKVTKTMQRKFWEFNLNGITGMPSITSIRQSRTSETFLRVVDQNPNSFKSMHN